MHAYKGIMLSLPCAALLVLIIFLPFIASGASLTVGTKVIYPGGTDQPPLEKDAGVKFSTGRSGDQAVERGVSATDIGQTSDSLAELAESGDFAELLQITEGRNDPDAQAYKALAMYETGDIDEAEELALKLLKNQRLSEELRQKLIDELGLNIDDPKDQQDQTYRQLP